MNNQQNYNYATDINTKIRPRRVYLTSDNVNDFTSSSRSSYILKENINAEEGFNLAFGISSLGLTASAHNISQRQENNKLLITLDYKLPLWIPYGDPDENGYYDYQQNPEVWNNALDDIKLDEPIRNQTFNISIPDGYYTLSSLFDYLNSQLNLFITSKIKRDIHANVLQESIDKRNEIGIQFIFSETTFGYRIDLEMKNQNLGKDSDTTVKNFYGSITQTAAENVNTGIDAYHVNYRPIGIKIQASPNAPHLYTMLFRNDSSTQFISPGCPSFVNEGTLHNPPHYIYFDIQNFLNSTENTNSINPWITENEVNNIDDTNLSFSYIGTFHPDEELNNLIHKYSGKTIPANFVNYPLTIYFKPTLNPIYVDISTDLETNNYTDDGVSSNILIRQFIPGNTNGVTDFYQSWNSPIWHSTLRQSINAITVNFESEKNKWDFFNLRFVLELIVFEYPEANEISQMVDQVFDIPSADPTTAYLNQYLGPPQNPFQVVTEPNFTPLYTTKLKRKK